MSDYEEHCPQCRIKEDKKVVCRNCGFEYKNENNLTSFEKFLVFLFFVFFSWFFVTLLYWLIEEPCLLDVLQSQWQWVLSKRIW